MPWKMILWLLAIASVAIGLLAISVSGQQISDEELARVPESEILRTIEHRNALLQVELPGVLNKQADTIAAQQFSLDKASLEAKGLQKEIDRQAGDLAACKVLAEKRNTAIWIRNSVIGLLVVAIGAYCFLKFYMRLPI